MVSSFASGSTKAPEKHADTTMIFRRMPDSASIFTSPCALSPVGSMSVFDTSIIAWGLRRYGYKAEAAQLAAGILDAAEFFAGRLPEAFAGYPRPMTRYPVRYPTACTPQAWSTGAPLLLLRTMLGLEPVGDHLVVDPALPPQVGHLELLDIPGRWKRVDAFARRRS